MRRRGRKPSTLPRTKQTNNQQHNTMENVFTTSTPTLGDRIKGKLFEAWYIPFAKLRIVAQRIALPFIIAQRRRL